MSISENQTLNFNPLKKDSYQMKKKINKHALLVCTSHIIFNSLRPNFKEGVNNFFNIISPYSFLFFFFLRAHPTSRKSTDSCRLSLAEEKNITSSCSALCYRLVEARVAMMKCRSSTFFNLSLF